MDVASKLAPSEVPRDLLQRIADGTQIDSRGCCTMTQAIQTAIYDPDADPRGPSTDERVSEWCNAARPLAAESSRLALAQAGVDPREVTHVVTASCTGFAAPGVDQWLVWDLGLPATCRRTHIGFMGCHAAINALAAADAYARAAPGAVVLVTSVEISTVHLHYGARMDRLIANSLFADGSSSAVVTVRGTLPPAAGNGVRGRAPSQRSPEIALTSSTLMADTAGEMAWRIGNHGFEMTLNSTVPSHLRREVGPWIRSVLQQAGLTPEQVGGWAIHPGGPRIVEAIADTLGLSSERTTLSREVLQQHGNMSSATVLFVVKRLHEEGAPLPRLAMSFGPGLAGEALVIV
ncbi:MAG: type III polyketide synthase [Phycisphaerae bacterium]|nr:type III polyketide synthase [Phycisphaerae bacterium]